MSTIFYSMAGEGRGHATRVRTVVEHLRSRHRLVLFAPGAAHAFLAELYAGTDVEVRPIPGLFFHYDRRGRVDRWATGRAAAGYLAGLSKLVGEIETAIERESPDLAITDFEPALPRAAKRAGVPFLSLSHQHFLVANDLSSLPFGLRVHAASMGLLVRAFYSGQERTIVSSFYAPPLKRGHEDVLQVGVLLRPSVLAAEARPGEHLVAYFRRSLDAATERALRECGRDVFVYGLGADASRGNLHFRPVSEEGFLADLSSAAALVSTAGNQLVGEALWLGKPVLAMPEQKNYEQFINAHFLEVSGAGTAVAPGALTTETLRAFLARLESYRAAARRHARDGTPAVLDAIERQLGEPSMIPRPFAASA